MKIIEVNTYFLKHNLVDNLGMAQGEALYRHAGMVEIVTDAGIVGWGEGLSVPSKKIIHKYLIDRNPFDIEVIWNDIGSLGWGAIAFLSGIDMALHDIVGKALNIPAYGIGNGKQRSKVKAYASGLLRKNNSTSADYLIDEALSYVDMGFTALKMKVGFEKDQDIKNVIAVREAIGIDTTMAIDANCGYSIEEAIDVGLALKDYNIAFFEEPTEALNVNAHLAIKDKIDIPLAGGELLRGKMAFCDLMLNNALDIVQPDLSIAGGISECKKIATIADVKNILVMPHMWGGISRLAATLQLIAMLPVDKIGDTELMLEYDMSENPFRTDISENTFEMIDGYVEIPNTPGLGVEINKAKILKYCQT